MSRRPFPGFHPNDALHAWSSSQKSSKCRRASSFGAWTWICERQVASTASPKSSMWRLRRTRRGWPMPCMGQTLETCETRPFPCWRQIRQRMRHRSLRGHPAGVPDPGVNTRSLGSEERHVGPAHFLASTAHGLQTNPTEGFLCQEAVRHAVGLPEYDVRKGDMLPGSLRPAFHS